MFNYYLRYTFGFNVKHLIMAKYQRLTKAEEEIMQMLWNESEPITVTNLIAKMEVDPKPPHSTVSSIVRILERKGFVHYNAYGRTHVYYPIVEKTDYTRTSINSIAKRYFQGSMNELVSFLVKENDLSIKDLSSIIKKLEEDNENE